MQQRFLVALMLMISSGLFAQNATRVEGTYITPIFSGKYQRVLDRAQSPVQYRGLGGGLGIGTHFHRKKWILENELLAHYNLLNPNFSQNPLNTKITASDANLQNYFFYEIQISEKWRHLAGVSLPVFVQYRLHSGHSNSSETWNAYALVGPAAGTQYHFRFLRKGWIAEGFAALPVWGYGTKPSFTRFFGRFTENISPRHWGNAYMLETRTRLRMLLMNGNQMGLQYTWTYFSDSVDNLSQLGSHQLQFYLLYKL